MVAIQTLRKMEKYNQIMLNLFGFNIFTENYGCSFNQFIVVSNIFTYTAITIYNVYLYRNDFINASFILVTFGYAIQVRQYILGKTDLNYLINFQGTSYVSTVHFLQETFRWINSSVYEYHNSASKEEVVQNVLNRYAIINYRMNFLIRIVFYFTALMAVGQPLIVYAATGEIKLPFAFRLPWINPDTSFGYFVNYMHQLFETIIVCFGMNLFQAYFLHHILHCCVQIDILQIKMKQLSEYANAIEEVEKDKNTYEINDLLSAIIRLHQEYLT